MSVYENLKQRFAGLSDADVVDLTEYAVNCPSMTPPPPLPQGSKQRDPLAMTASCEQIVDRVFYHLSEKWKLELESHFALSAAEWRFVENRLEFLLVADNAGDRRVKHILTLFLYVSKFTDNSAATWLTLTNDLREWVVVQIDAVGTHSLTINADALESHRVCDVAQGGQRVAALPAWICRTLLDPRVVDAYCAILAGGNVSTTRGQATLLLEQMQIHLIRRRVERASEPTRGWATHDGVCLVLNEFPVLPFAARSEVSRLRDAVSAAQAGYGLQLLLHESAHYLLRCLCNDLDTSSPFRANATQNGAGLSAVQYLNELPRKIDGYDGQRMNYEIGVDADFVTVGLLIDYRRALELRTYELIVALVSKLERFVSCPGAALPMLDASDIAKIDRAQIRYAAKICSFGRFCVKPTVCIRQ